MVRYCSGKVNLAPQWYDAEASISGLLSDASMKINFSPFFCLPEASVFGGKHSSAWIYENFLVA